MKSPKQATTSFHPLRIRTNLSPLSDEGMIMNCRTMEEQWRNEMVGVVG